MNKQALLDIINIVYEKEYSGVTEVRETVSYNERLYIVNVVEVSTDYNVPGYFYTAYVNNEITMETINTCARKFKTHGVESIKGPIQFMVEEFPGIKMTEDAELWYKLN